MTSDLKNRNNNSNGTGTSNSINSEEFKKTDEERPNILIRNSLIKLKSYLIALRVWSLSASIIPTILGKSKKTVVFSHSLVLSRKNPQLNNIYTKYCIVCRRRLE